MAGLKFLNVKLINRMKKLLLKISEYKLVFISIAFLVFFSVGCVKKDEKEIKIGAILPLTGDAAQWGIPPMKGAQLAVEEINSRGGVNGKKILLKIEDDRCDPKDGVSAFKKLTMDKELKIILGAVCSSVTLAVAPIAENNKILLISPASTNPTITVAGDYIFRVIPSDDLRGKIFAEYLYNDAKIKNVAILDINNDGGVGSRNSFLKCFTELGGKIVIDESYEQGTKDVRSQLSKIKNSDVDAVLVISYPSDTILTLKQTKELKLQKPLYFLTEAVEDPNVLKESGNTSEGIVYILPAEPEGMQVSEFKKSYRAKYDTKPELFAAEAYDIINLIANAISLQDIDFVSTENIRDYLYNMKNYQGASGIITFDHNGDVLKPMAIKKIINGQPTVLKTK